jgi:ABC-type transport system involved in cytochrome c biogenesis permease subunit
VCSSDLKILYVHPPLAYGAYLGFTVTAICGALYLWRDDEQWDRLAIAGAEVGVIFCTLMLITGPIWARGTWGKWWSWDPRLTVTLLLWFVYLAYLLLRNFSDSGTRTARMAAVYGMVGAAMGWGLDALFGTLPIFLIVFILLGFAAGIRTVMRSAGELQKKQAADAAREIQAADAAREMQAADTAEEEQGAERRGE